MTARDTRRLTHIPLTRVSPKKKKDQLSLAQWWWGINSPANRPDPDDPGGLGAEESGTERTGPTQCLLFASPHGVGLAEVGRYCDFSNNSVSKRQLSTPIGISAMMVFVFAGLLPSLTVGAIMTLL